MSLTIQFAVLAALLVTIAGQESGSVPKKEDLMSAMQRLGVPAEVQESFAQALPAPPHQPIERCCPKKQNYDCGTYMAYYPSVFYYSDGDYRYICWKQEEVKHVTHCNCSTCVKEDDRQCFLFGRCSVDYYNKKVEAFCFRLSRPLSVHPSMSINIRVGRDCSCKAKTISPAGSIIAPRRG